jgi:hypothetical protein
MKLERLHSSQYYHNSLGEITFYNRFKKRISLGLRDKLVGYLLEDSLVASYILFEYLRSIRYERDGK